MHWPFLQNMSVALALGIVIGLERQWRQHSAGLRTNALVALGTALFVSLSRLMGDSSDPTRMASYIVSGLGFLGGGVILRDGMNVKGMNTAATLWCTGAVGTLSGAGYTLEAITGTVAILAVNLGLRPVVRWIDARNKAISDMEVYYRLRVTCVHTEIAHIRAVLMRHISGQTRMSVHGITTAEYEKEGKVIIADIYALERNDRAMEEIVASLSNEQAVTGVSWHRTEG